MSSVANAVSMSLAEAMEQALALAQAGRLEEAQRLYQDVLASNPRNVPALTNLGVVQVQLGAYEEGTACLERALAITPGDQEIRRNLYEAYSTMSTRALTAEDRESAISIYRKILKLDLHDIPVRNNLELLLTYTDKPAVLGDFETGMRPEQLGRTVLIACMPKSGSSWLVNAMRLMTGFQQAPLCNAYLENEQELFAPAVKYWANVDKVVHQHCRASSPNLHLIQAYRMSPVVLVRNLADTLVSMRDFWAIGAVRNSFMYGDWETLDEETKLDAIVRHLGPWYIQFYVSWQLAESRGYATPCWVRYEDMMADKAGTLKGVAAFCGLTPSEDDIQRAVVESDGSRKKTRFNKGIAGRGAETFSAAQLDALRELTRPFPSIDFTPIGL